MHESVLVHADIDEGTKISDVCHDTGANHSGLEIFDLVNVFAILKRHELFARIASRFF